MIRMEVSCHYCDLSPPHSHRFSLLLLLLPLSLPRVCSSASLQPSSRVNRQLLRQPFIHSQDQSELALFSSPCLLFLSLLLTTFSSPLPYPLCLSLSSLAVSLPVPTSILMAFIINCVAVYESPVRLTHFKAVHTIISNELDSR